MERAEAKLRDEEERGARAEAEVGAVAERAGLLEAEAEGLKSAVAETVERAKGLVQQLLGGEGAREGGEQEGARGKTARGGGGGEGREGGKGGLTEAPTWAQALQEQIQGACVGLAPSCLGRCLRDGSLEDAWLLVLRAASVLVGAPFLAAV
eukprot:344332-Rhodomonas_salina.1